MQNSRMTALPAAFNEVRRGKATPNLLRLGMCHMHGCTHLVRRSSHRQRPGHDLETPGQRVATSLPEKPPASAHGVVPVIAGLPERRVAHSLSCPQKWLCGMPHSYASYLIMWRRRRNSAEIRAARWLGRHIRIRVSPGGSGCSWLPTMEKCNVGALL